MKKHSILWIFLLIGVFLLIVNFLFQIIYFDNFNKNLKPLSESEKQKVIEILNKSIELEGYQIKIGSIFAAKDQKLVHVELINGSLRKRYLVDLKKEIALER